VTSTTHHWLHSGIKGEPQYLTGLDLRVGHSFNSFLLVYPQGLDHEAMVASLRKVLALYPAFTGRLRKDAQGDVFIDLNDAGASFNVVHHERALPPYGLGNQVDSDFRQYTPHPWPWQVVDNPQPLMVVSVHQFACGGALLAVGGVHSVADGNAVWMFMMDWLRMHMGQPVTPPVKDRQALINACTAARERPYTQGYLLQAPLLSRLGHAARMVWQHFTQNSRTSFRVSPEQVAAWRAAAHAEMGEDQIPAAHDFVVAFCMQALSGAMHNHRPRYLGQISDLRLRRLPGIPRKYSGNAIGHDLLQLDGAQLAQASLTQAAQRCRMSFDRNSEEDLLSYLGLMARHRVTRTNNTVWVRGIVECLGNGIMLNNCAHFPIYKMDFGRGLPTWFDFERAPYRMLVLTPTPGALGGFDVHVTARKAEVAALKARAAQLAQAQSAGKPQANLADRAAA
jgi:Transferase family